MSIVALTAVLALAATEDTPAGRQLTSWLTAFNSTDRTTLLAYHDRHFPYSAASRDVADVERELRLGRATGGFEVRKVEQLTALSLTAYLKERSRPGFARVRLEVDSKPPHKVVNFEIGPIPPPDELLTPEERALATVNPAKRRRLIDGIARELEAHYVHPEVAKRMVAAIRKHDAEGRYDAITSAPAGGRQTGWRPPIGESRRPPARDVRGAPASASGTDRGSASPAGGVRLRPHQPDGGKRCPPGSQRIRT